MWKGSAISGYKFGVWACERLCAYFVVMQELHEADLAASVAQEQLAHERQRTGRLKHAIKSAFEEARTPAAGIAGEPAVNRSLPPMA